MSERAVISYASGADAAALRAALRDAGAATVEPIASLPDTLLATVDAGAIDAFLRRAAALPGVRAAERDEMRSTS